VGVFSFAEEVFQVMWIARHFILLLG